MTEPIPCPSCQSLLRLPPGAATVRCPNCKTVLAVELADPTPAAPQPAPTPATPVRPPLPFGGPAPATPVRRPRGAPALPKRRAVRAKIAADDPYEAPAAAPAAPDAKEKRREILRQLEEYEEEKEREEEVFQELAGQCAHVRTGLQLMAVGALASALIAVLTMFFYILSLLDVFIIPLLFLAGGLLAIHWLLTLAGFGFCCAGMAEMRATAIFGLVFTTGHAVFNVACTLVTVGGMVLAELGVPIQGVAFSSMLLSNALSNMTVIGDIPLYIVFSFPGKTSLLVLILLAAAFEFAKLSTVGLITNQYATAGKDPNLAYMGMRFVYRIFWLVLALPIVKVVTYVMIGILFPLGIISIPLMSLTVAFYAWWAFAWFAQFQVLNDTREIMTAVRVADKRARLDTV